MMMSYNYLGKAANCMELERHFRPETRGIEALTIWVWHDVFAGMRIADRNQYQLETKIGVN